MTGEQLYGAMQTLSPKMITKIGFMTGHSISFSVRSFFGRTERPYIEKPIIVKELLSLITKLKKDND